MSGSDSQYKSYSGRQNWDLRSARSVTSHSTCGETCGKLVWYQYQYSRQVTVCSSALSYSVRTCFCAESTVPVRQQEVRETEMLELDHGPRSNGFSAKGPTFAYLNRVLQSVSRMIT